MAMTVADMASQYFAAYCTSGSLSAACAWQHGRRIGFAGLGGTHVLQSGHGSGSGGGPAAQHVPPTLPARLAAAQQPRHRPRRLPAGGRHQRRRRQRAAQHQQHRKTRHKRIGRQPAQHGRLAGCWLRGCRPAAASAFQLASLHISRCSLLGGCAAAGCGIAAACTASQRQRHLQGGSGRCLGRLCAVQQLGCPSGGKQ